jgi:hypothetical protein
MSDLRIFETPKGAMCGTCVEGSTAPQGRRSALKSSSTTRARTTVADEGATPDVFPYEANAWPGGYCAECFHVMPADGHPCGRPPPHADQAATTGEYVARTRARKEGDDADDEDA